MAKYNGRCVGNKETDEVHKPDCAWVPLIDEKNKVYFATVQEAIDAGYSPHDHEDCLAEWCE